MTHYLGIFATPGGDKHHLFSIEEVPSATARAL